MNSSEPSQPSMINLQKQPTPQITPPAIPPTDEYGSILPMLLATPRRCDASAGVMWMVQAVSLFQRQPLLWLAMGATLMIILGVLASIPFLNVLMVMVVFVFSGGIIQGAAAQSRGDELRFDHLFSGFKSHLKPLVMLGLWYLVGTIVCMIPMFVAMGSMMFALFNSDYGTVGSLSISAVIFGYLISMLLFIPLTMAIWFAPALIVLHDVDAVTAMKKSFEGSKQNLMPMFVFGLVCLLLVPVVVFFTLGLGIFVILPILLLIYFTSYRDVWTDQPLNAH